MLRTALVLSLSCSFVSLACASPPPAAGEERNDSDETSKTAAVPPSSGAPSAPAAPSPSDTAAPAAPPSAPAIAMAKIHDAHVWDYAVTEDNVWVATDTVVERTAPDGSAVTPVPELAAANAVASDGTRVYAVLDRGSSMFELRSIKTDGTGGAHHLDWDAYYDGEPTTLSIHGGRLYLSAMGTTSPEDSSIVSLAAAPPLGDGNAPVSFEGSIDARFVPPTFTTDKLFAIDGYRQAAVGLSVVAHDATFAVVRDDLPPTATAIATNGTDVFVRTNAGIVKVPAAAKAATASPTVIVPAASCSIVDPADGSSSMLEDTVASDATTIYAACREAANVEIRAYDASGKQQKIVATAPYTGALTRLRLTSKAVYWLARSTTPEKGDELWRAGR